MSTAIAVLAVAAYVSYWHAYAVVCVYDETGATARLEPATIDGLVHTNSVLPRAGRCLSDVLSP